MFTEKFFESPGSSTMSTYIWEIAIILLGAFLLGYLLRLMLNSKYKKRIADLEEELDVLKAKKPEVVELPAVAAPFDTSEYDLKIRDQRREIDKLNLKISEYHNAKISAETSLDAVKMELAEIKANASKKTETSDFKASLGAISEEVKKPEVEIKTPDMDVSSTSLNIETADEQTGVSEVVETVKDEVSEVKEDANEVMSSKNADISTESEIEERIVPNDRSDLKKIEGIGPKIESLLNEAGIYSYKDLKEANPDYIREVLVAAGPNYAVHDPATWSEQATLANNGNWDALARLQEVLKGGKRK